MNRRNILREAVIRRPYISKYMIATWSAIRYWSLINFGPMLQPGRLFGTGLLNGTQEYTVFEI